MRRQEFPDERNQGRQLLPEPPIFLVGGAPNRYARVSEQDLARPINPTNPPQASGAMRALGEECHDEAFRPAIGARRRAARKGAVRLTQGRWVRLSIEVTSSRKVATTESFSQPPSPRAFLMPWRRNDSAFVRRELTAFR
jgi:hypothetical protein